jgi:integrase
MTLQRIDHNLPAITASPEDKAEPLSQQDYVAIKSQLTTRADPTIGRRDLLVVKGLRATGLRIREFLRVTGADVGQQGQFVGIHIRRGKQGNDTDGGRKYRWEWVYLPIEYGLEYREWVAAMAVRGSAPVFDVSVRTVERNFRDAAEKALGRRAHPHQLRGLYSMTVARIAKDFDLGMNLEVSAIMLGHSSIKTTRGYYTALTTEVRQEIQRRVGEFV